MRLINKITEVGVWQFNAWIFGMLKSVQKSVVWEKHWWAARYYDTGQYEILYQLNIVQYICWRCKLIGEYIICNCMRCYVYGYAHIRGGGIRAFNAINYPQKRAKRIVYEFFSLNNAHFFSISTLWSTAFLFHKRNICCKRRNADKYKRKM